MGSALPWCSASTRGAVAGALTRAGTGLGYENHRAAQAALVNGDDDPDEHRRGVFGARRSQRLPPDQRRCRPGWGFAARDGATGWGPGQHAERGVVPSPVEVPLDLGETTQHAGHLTGGGTSIELCDRVDLVHPTGDEHRDPISQGGLVEIVRDDHGGGCQYGAHLTEQLVHGGAHPGVKRAERLVEQQHARLGRQCPSQRHSLFLTSGEGCGSSRRQVSEVDQSEVVARPGPRPAPGVTRHPVGEPHVVEHVEVGKEEGPLEEHRHAAPLGRARAQVHLAHEHLTLLGQYQPRGHPQGAGLARP